jgi:glutathione synthetase
MNDIIPSTVVDDAVEKASQLSLNFLHAEGVRHHVPFTFTPSPILPGTVSQLELVSPLLGRLTHELSLRGELLNEVHDPLAAGDPFFSALLSCHRELLSKPNDLLRTPLLLQRSDFMLDKNLGPKLVECNSIAAGMAPFGEQIQLLHKYLSQTWPDYSRQFSATWPSELLSNPATTGMAIALANTAQQIAKDLNDNSSPSFLMVVQEEEDNVFDQYLLEKELEGLGVKTYRRTFRQLHEQLSTGPKQSLQLEGCGTVHVVYLRAGYQYKDFIATDLDTQRCCDALQSTRIFIERHRVAVNATVAQQLASSKRMQLYVTDGGKPLLQELGFSSDEQSALTAVLAKMRRVDASSIDALQRENDCANWVLKNQGEGGGHCFFDHDISHRLNTLQESEYGAWILMQRLRPIPRAESTLIIRDGQTQRVDGLVSEIGIFTAHLNGLPLATNHLQPGLIGYLVRSKPPGVTEGGIHGGYGALDSLCY